MNRKEIVAEIERVKTAIDKSKSQKLKHDYGKHLKRLYQNLKYYDKQMGKWQQTHAIRTEH